MTDAANRTRGPVLPDVLQPGLQAVFCGTAAGTVSARLGAYYAGPGNRFWWALHEVGLTPVQLEPLQFMQVSRYGLGLTDMAKTAFGSDAEIPDDAFDRGALRRKVRRFAPRWLVFTSKAAAKSFSGGRSVAYGVQKERIGGTRLFVVPSPSGRARRNWSLAPWQELALLVAAAPHSARDGECAAAGCRAQQDER